MNNHGFFKRVVAFVMAGLAVNVFALQGWINRGTGSMNDSANWSGRVVPTIDQSSANSSWCFWYAKDSPTVMTLASDLVTDRMIIAGNTSDDKSGSDVTFALGAGKTLTFKGSTGIAIRIHGADDVKLKVTSGTFKVDSATADRNCVYFPSNEKNYTSNAAGSRNVFTVDGANSALVVPKFYLDNGADNALIVTNGASFTGDLELSTSRCLGNAFRVSGTGSRFAFSGTSGLFKAFDNQAATNGLVEVTGGAAVSGVQTLNIGGFRTCVRVSGAGTAVATTGARSTIGNTSGGMTSLEVSEGASFTFGGNDGRFWVGARTGSPSNTIHVTGAGTTFRAESSSNHIMANGSGGQAFIVEDGATSEVGGNFRLGAGNGDGNLLRVAGGATARFLNVYVGHGENGANAGNRLEVRGAGTKLSLTGELVAGYLAATTGNKIDIRDGAAVMVQSVTLGRQGDDNMMTVSGDSVVSNTATITDFKIGSASSRNRLRADGGRLLWNGNMYTGRFGDSSTGTNAVEILGGGHISVESGKDFFLFGAENTLVVSNGLLTAREVHLPYFNNSDASPMVRLCGTNPVIRASGKLQIRRNATVLLAPEGEGYLEPPLQSNGALDIITSTRIVCDFSSLAMKDGGSCVIARGNPLTVNDDVLDTIGQSLPYGYYARVRNNELVLSRSDGVRIIFR